MSKHAKIKGEDVRPELFSAESAPEGWYICTTDDVWEEGTIVYKDYADRGTVSAMGTGYIPDTHYHYRTKMFSRLPDDVEIICGN